MHNKNYGQMPVTVRLPASEIRRVGTLAQQNGLTRSEFLRRLIADAPIVIFQTPPDQVQQMSGGSR